MVCSASLHQIIPNILLGVGFPGGADNSTPVLMIFNLQKVVAREEQVFFTFISDAFLPRRGVAPGLVSEYLSEMSMLPSTFSLPKEAIKEKSNNEFSYCLKSITNLPDTANVLDYPE